MFRNLAFRYCFFLNCLTAVKAQVYGPSRGFESSTPFGVYLNETLQVVGGLEHKLVAVDLPLYAGLLVEKLHNLSFVSSMIKDNANSKMRLLKLNPAPEGKTFRVAAIVEPPFVAYFNLSEEERREQRTGPGIVIEILRTMEKLHNFRFEFSTPEDGAWGESSETTGKWNGMFGMLQREEVELLAAASIIRFDRHAVADYTYPFYASETGMLIRSPERYIDNRFLIVTAPFKWQVWALTALAVVVSGGIMKALSFALQSASEIRYTWWEATWVFFSVFVQQGLPVQPRSWTCRTLLAFWWLAALTLVATFTGNMVALFAVSRAYLPFNTVEEMVDKVRYDGYKVVTPNKSTTKLKFIQNSGQGLYRKLWYEMSVKGKWVNVSTYEEGIEVVKASPKMVFLAPKETLQVYSARDCNVTVTPAGFIPVMYSIAMAKRSPFTELFSHEIRDLVEMGFITKWWNDYSNTLATERGTLCASREGVTNAGDAIDIVRAQGAFWILLGGTILAASGFAIEFVMRLIREAMRAVDGKRWALSCFGRPRDRSPSVRDRYAIDARYQKSYDTSYGCGLADESSRSYQPAAGLYGSVLPDLVTDGRTPESKRHQAENGSVTVLRF